MSIEILTKQDLETFRDEIISEIRTVLTQLQPIHKKWLRSAEVQDLLNVSAGTLQNLKLNGTLVPTKVGGTLFYSYEDIQRVLSGN